MYATTLYPKTASVLTKLKKLPFLSDYYLAGGTALALQIGHRKSIDLDFFSSQPFDPNVVVEHLQEYHPTVTQLTTGTLDVFIDEVKISFLQYQYPLLEPFNIFEGVELASVLDIACMKLTAISSRGSKKDFVDLYYILQSYTLPELFTALEQKYVKVDYNKAHIIKSLCYFIDADSDPDVDYLNQTTNWSTIKTNLIQLHKEIFKSQ